jgi:hypothetical protein
MRVEHVARHWADGGDRYTIRLWRRSGDDGAHAQVRLPLAMCPTQAVTDLVVDSLRAYQEASVAAGLGDPLDELARVFAALDEPGGKKES